MAHALVRGVLAASERLATLSVRSRHYFSPNHSGANAPTAHLPPNHIAPAVPPAIHEWNKHRSHGSLKAGFLVFLIQNSPVCLKVGFSTMADTPRDAAVVARLVGKVVGFGRLVRGLVCPSLTSRRFPPSERTHLKKKRQ